MVDFRWMPLYAPQESRYLVAIGVSLASVEDVVAWWVSIGNWIALLVVFISQIWLVGLVSQLGYIYDQREPDSDGSKWRRKR